MAVSAPAPINPSMVRRQALRACFCPRARALRPIGRALAIEEIVQRQARRLFSCKCRMRRELTSPSRACGRSRRRFIGGSAMPSIGIIPMLKLLKIARCARVVPVSRRSGGRSSAPAARHRCVTRCARSPAAWRRHHRHPALGATSYRNSCHSLKKERRRRTGDVRSERA